MRKTRNGKSFFSRMLSLPEQNPERIEFEKEIWLLGAYWQCRYDLSVATDTDQFAVSDDEYFANACTFITSRTSPEASVFFRGCTHHDLGYFRAILRAAYEEKLGIPPQAAGRKQREAIRQLMLHPSWSNARIAAAAGTTEKQLQRNVEFSALRHIQQAE